jgi:hypothetical protein
VNKYETIFRPQRERHVSEVIDIEELFYAKLLPKLGTGNRQLRTTPNLLGNRSCLPPLPPPLRASRYASKDFTQIGVFTRSSEVGAGEGGGVGVYEGEAERQVERQVERRVERRVKRLWPYCDEAYLRFNRFGSGY